MWYLFFLPLIFAYDCEEICRVKISVKENTVVEKLQWNLMELLANRTATAEQFQYSLSNPSDYFEIHSKILKFRGKEIDRERICPNIFITDSCTLELQIFTQTAFLILFQLIILDENDWQPVFHQNSIALTIPENLPINYRVQLPIAYDFDSIEYNIDHYQFVNDTDEIERIFLLEKLHDELRLKLLKQFDCERKTNYQLFIIAIDKGGWKSNLLHVNITIGDVNEYQPRFSQRFYHTRISENLPIINSTSSSILQIIAIDDDCSDRIIHYSIINNEIPFERFPFFIEKTTGLIRVKEQLDYETISNYRFRVRASNLDQITSSIVLVIIDILDINDNQPLIHVNILNEYAEKMMIKIKENIPIGQVIGTVLIRDNDSPMINYRLGLEMLSCLPLTISCPIEFDIGIGNTSFSPTTSLIRISRLLNSELGDRKFTVLLQARDYGQPSLKSEYRLMVEITDVNDCAPKFTRKNYRFRVSNSSPIGSVLGQIQAIDDDYSPHYRRIQYQFLDSHLININPPNGSLVLVQSPSIEIYLNITVLAIDQENHSLFDQAIIEIFFYNQTMCALRFDQTVYVFNTIEHEIIPYEIGQVNVSHCRLSSTSISYKLIETNSSSFPFSIDSITGKIIVIRELDREIQDFYQFSIHSINNETEEFIQAEIEIHILDKNDHHPIFKRFHEQYIYISTHHHHHHHHHPIVITNLHAIDADIGLNSRIDYYFTDKDLYSYFHLYSNGSLMLYNSLNIHLPIRLEIFARDRGYPMALNSTESLIIYLCDSFKRHECSSSTLRRDFYLASIFLMILVVGFLLIVILWRVFLHEQLGKKDQNYRMEGRKNLIIADQSSPIMNGEYQLKHAMI